jgi:hypothetical protein
VSQARRCGLGGLEDCGQSARPNRLKSFGPAVEKKICDAFRCWGRVFPYARGFVFEKREVAGALPPLTFCGWLQWGIVGGRDGGFPIRMPLLYASDQPNADPGIIVRETSLKTEHYPAHQHRPFSQATPHRADISALCPNRALDAAFSFRKSAA